MSQQDAVENWWFDATEHTRERALRLGETDLLPDDMAVGLQLAGVAVTPVDTSDGPAHVIPDVVKEFLEATRGLRFR